MNETRTDTPTWLWETGDLYQFPIGRVLCVGAGDTFAQFLTADGLPLADIQVLDAPKSDYFLQRTRLRYTYQSRAQLLADYRAGVFTLISAALNAMIYAKCLQHDELCNYYKIDPAKNPVVVEVVSFLGNLPHVRVDTYSRDTPGGRIEIDALLNHYPRIGKAEYEAAFRKATETDFEVLG